MVGNVSNWWLLAGMFALGAAASAAAVSSDSLIAERALFSTDR